MAAEGTRFGTVLRVSAKPPAVVDGNGERWPEWPDEAEGPKPEGPSSEGPRGPRSEGPRPEPPAPAPAAVRVRDGGECNSVQFVSVPGESWRARAPEEAPDEAPVGPLVRREEG